MTSAITRVTRAASVRRADPLWRQRRAIIGEERLGVEKLLSSRLEHPVYGFTTLLGQLDDSALRVGDQERLLTGHLVGPTSEIFDPIPGLMLAIKIEQLACGGSGIHADIYGYLLECSSHRMASMIGAWRASYSSADVVPGAWWLRALQADAGMPRLRSGDLIALISGNFVSTTFALAASLRAMHYLAYFLAYAAAYADAVPTGATAASRTWLYQTRPAWRPIDKNRTSQRPVSLRDVSLYVSPIARVLDDLRDAIEFRLSGCTSNPLFIFPSSGAAVASSQAGFVDVRLSMALTSAIQLVLFCMGGVQRFVQHLCDGKRELSAEEFIPFVQPPKVASALLAQARLAHGAMATGFSLAESDGIEDMCDMSLSLAYELRDVVWRAEQQMRVLTSLAPSDIEPASQVEFFELIAARFGEDDGMEQISILASLSAELVAC